MFVLTWAHDDFPSQEIPFTIEPPEELKLDEPILKKQMFIPDTPIFPLPDIPKIIFPQEETETRRLIINWARGSFDLTLLGFDYKHISSKIHRSFNGSIYSSFGQDEKNKLYTEEKRIDYLESKNFFREAVSSNFLLSAQENIFYKQRKSRATFNNETKCYVADGITLSNRFDFSKTIVDDVSSFLVKNDAQINYTPDEENNFFLQLHSHWQFPVYKKSKLSSTIGFDKLFFRRLLLSLLAKYEYEQFYPEVSATVKVIDKLRAYFRYSSGYSDLFFDDLFFRKYFLLVNTNLDYPRNIFSFAEGVNWYISKESFLGFEIFQKKTRGYVYWETKTAQEYITASAYDEIYLAGAKLKLNYKYKHFEFSTDILYNIHEVPYEAKYCARSGVSLDLKKLFFIVKYNLEAERYTTTDRNIKLSDNSFVDIEVGRQVRDVMRFSVEARNIFSANRETQSGFFSNIPEYIFNISFIF